MQEATRSLDFDRIGGNRAAVCTFPVLYVSQTSL
jgi:hypothetical protein